MPGPQTWAYLISWVRIWDEIQPIPGGQSVEQFFYLHQPFISFPLPFLSYEKKQKTYFTDLSPSKKDNDAVV